ncbi:MAG: DUF4091 domain-containing protein, partial [Nitrosomonadales bacterium]
GAMNYAYQHEFGQSLWNDFDDASATHARDHVFAYPTSDGVIDTIQWEGWREGVDDTRYLATLIKKEGCDTSARALVSDSLSKGDDMATIREKVIAKILMSSPAANKKLEFGVVNIKNKKRRSYRNIDLPFTEWYALTYQRTMLATRLMLPLKIKQCISTLNS